MACSFGCTPLPYSSQSTILPLGAVISPLTSIPEHTGQTNMACARRANRACRRLTPRLPQPLFRPLRPNRPRPPPKLPPISFLTPWRIFFPPIGSAICAPRGCAGAARVRTTPTRHAAVRAVCAPLLCAAHQSVRNKCCFQSALSGARPFPVAAEMGAENLNQPAYICIAVEPKTMAARRHFRLRCRDMFPAT